MSTETIDIHRGTIPASIWFDPETPWRAQVLIAYHRHGLEPADLCTTDVEGLIEALTSLRARMTD